MASGGGVPGGMIHMNASSRPFVPGTAVKPSIVEPPTPIPYHPPLSSFANASRSPVPQHRLGHALNPGSVQLTGLPTFLATPPVINHMPHMSRSPSYTGPPSPISPNFSGAASPFVMPPAQMSYGLPLPAGLMNGNMKPRRAKGLPPVTPLKTTGHNSTPSISMNPAAFAANLAALKARKKVVVCLPAEQLLPDDEALLAQPEDESLGEEVKSDVDGVETGARASEPGSAKSRHARASALTRSRWVQRQPLSSDKHDLVPFFEAPREEIVTCDIHPEPWPYSLGLPDTIEIYLPGMSAWDEYLELRYEEQQMEAAATDHEPRSPLAHQGIPLPPSTAGFTFDRRGRSLSISTPADPGMVTFKLNRFLESQQQQLSQYDSDQVCGLDSAQNFGDADKPFGRFQTDLPNRLREAFARRRGDSSDLNLRPSLKTTHNHTMSLGLPSSGGPFGPEVFSALDMIRANSDEGPSKPPSEAQDLPQKPLSDTEAFAGKSEIYLSNIAEEDGEQEPSAELAVEGHTRVGSWKDLGRGFGYEPQSPNAAPNGTTSKHIRQASRFSVNTSRHDGEENDELGFDGEEAEIRTNPSEDADASDFEEEPNEYGADHWRSRHNSVHLSAFGDGHDRYADDNQSHASNDDSLQDSLTPSDEQFSNPSDEEAAREERILRRQHRAAERAACRERKQRQRGRAYSDNTLPSSSIGEADIHHNGVYGQDEQQRNPRNGNTISNPSEQEHCDIDDDSQTFGHNDRSNMPDQGPQFSRDFRFPPLNPCTVDVDPQVQSSSVHSGNCPPMSGTLGRASGISLLNPDAKEFKFGGTSASTRSVSAPQPSMQTAPEAAGAHFRLPSIKTSSFGSSALGDAPTNAAHLNVGAAPFTPGLFTFKAIQRLQVPENSLSASPSIAVTSADGGADHRETENRDMQGREKRTRYGPIDYDSQDERSSVYSPSPPRPKASAATIEGPLRIFSSLARNSPQPFLPVGYSQQQRAVSHESRLTADAPSFVPTWAKSSQLLGGSTSFKRPSLPDWDQQGQQAVDKDLPSILDPTFFSRDVESKAIPVGRASKDDVRGAARPSLSSASTLASVDKQANKSAVEPSRAADVDSGQETSETHQGPFAWQPSASNRLAPRTQPMHIPSGPRSCHSPSISQTSDAGHVPSIRWGDRRTSSRMSMSSLDRRFRRSCRGKKGPDDVGGNDEDDYEDEEESVTDIIEEIVERMDKVLEGWAGKILDEVTIMGQVRPHPRNLASVSDFPLDQEKLVQDMFKRMEEALDSRLTPALFASHARRASDETQSTIRPLRQRNSSSDVKTANSSLADAPGEWDFDYVQDILDVKLGEFRNQIESTLAQVMAALDKNGHLGAAVKPNGNDKYTNDSGPLVDFAEVVTARLMTQLESTLQLHLHAAKEFQSASDVELQKAMQSKLDENLFLLSEKGATDRSSIQHMLESEMHGLERSFSKIVSSVEEHIRSALMLHLPPLLADKASSDGTLADRLTNQLGSALGPVLSEERRCMLEEHQRSRDLLLEALPSSTQIAQSTIKLVEPLVKSLKSEPIDSDALVKRLAEVIGKQSIEHLVDLNPVLALIEPLIVKHEEARAFSKKILQRQEDTERTLCELPGAINAKTEIFLSSANDTSERQGLILEKIAEIKAEIKDSSSTLSNAASLNTDALHRRLEDLAKDKILTRETAEKTLSELASVYQVLDSSYQALSRLEAQHTSSEESHRDATAWLEKQAQANADLAKELREAEARAARAEAGQAEAEAKLSSLGRESDSLRDQLAQLTAEFASFKAERTKEQEASEKAVADAMARVDRAEAASVETQDRMSRLLEQANVAEREAYDSAKSVLERASKAEGQVAALEKRIAEQDNKIGNLQQLSATQKQKAAQSHQKLAEGEKRVKELEGKAEELAEAAIRLRLLEEKANELEDVRRQLHDSVEREALMKKELTKYDDRFSEMETELVEIKDSFVERSVHEEVQRKYTESQKLVEQLEAKLQTLTASPLTFDGWEAVEKQKTGAWASMHAPRVHIEDVELVGHSSRSIRSVSFASTAGSQGKKEVEVDEGGWWS